MEKYALLFPVAPGKTDTEAKSIAAMFRADPAGYAARQKSTGITLERVYLQKTPMGNFVIAYLEGTNDFPSTIGALLSSDLPINGRFIEMVRDIHGVDLRQPPAGPPPETLAAWSDPNVTKHGRGFAFTAPVAPGKTAEGRAFAKEAFQDRSADFAASRRALGQNAEVVTLQQTPQGDVINVYLEGADPVEANRRHAASNTPYERWFKDQLRKIFPPFIDFDKPVPGVEEFFDSEALKVTA